MLLSDSSEKMHNISDEKQRPFTILSRIITLSSWVSFRVSSRKITSLDDANSFLFNAYSVSSKKVYAIRAPDHPPARICNFNKNSHILFHCLKPYNVNASEFTAFSKIRKTPLIHGSGREVSLILRPGCYEKSTITSFFLSVLL